MRDGINENFTTMAHRKKPLNYIEPNAFMCASYFGSNCISRVHLRHTVTCRAVPRTLIAHIYVAHISCEFHVPWATEMNWISSWNPSHKSFRQLRCGIGAKKKFRWRHLIEMRYDRRTHAENSVFLYFIIFFFVFVAVVVFLTFFFTLFPLCWRLCVSSM